MIENFGKIFECITEKFQFLVERNIYPCLYKQLIIGKFLTEEVTYYDRKNFLERKPFI